MKTALTAPSKMTTKQTASPSMVRVANQDVWARASMLGAAVGLLFYLWSLVHFDDSGASRGGSLGQVYTVYTCALLLFVGISVLWR